MGHGRYYDPTIGRPLQPHTAVAPPTLPQALNRYTAVPLGQPGVFEAEISSASYTNVALATSFVKTLTFETAARSTRSIVAYSGYASIAFQTSEHSLNVNRAAIEAVGGVFERSIHNTTRLVSDGSRLSKLRFRTDVYQFKVGLHEAENLATQLAATGQLVQKGGWRAMTHVETLGLTYRRAPRFPLLANTVLGLGTDAILGGVFQYYEDAHNPSFTREQRIARAGIASFGGAASGLAGVYIASLACGPGVPLCIAGGSLIAGGIWVFGVQPVIFNSVPGLQPPPRNLQPFN